ncbi:hypothetical protein [Nitrosomonas sp. H1_AOB3]|uniref:hypothetical protein n=1 Tax=Nitrosomonas sp. H1_AOB3 TaxID=2741553 RepID=UPI001934B97F|nr:hypothetical protein [Nitrosomonas sp. H1_AOB3]QOJ09409.1 MAG: hypothetical protein HRU73_08050 [Nitrosomonas sp. H1_AOB3]
MGLDWNPIGKPVAGHEEEYEKLFKLLSDTPIAGSWRDKFKQLFQRIDRDAVTKRWLEIQVAPYVTIQAPQVGIDARADEWAKARYKENPPKDKTEAELLYELRGYYVVALAPPCDGIPYYSNGPAGYVELYSFRSQCIVVDCKDIVGKALLEKCYQSCLAPGLSALGAELRACASDYASKHNVIHVEAVRELDTPEGSPESKAHILFSAARWCEYWSSRGHVDLKPISSLPAAAELRR